MSEPVTSTEINPIEIQESNARAQIQQTYPWYRIRTDIPYQAQLDALIAAQLHRLSPQEIAREAQIEVLKQQFEIRMRETYAHIPVIQPINSSANYQEPKKKDGCRIC